MAFSGSLFGSLVQVTQTLTRPNNTTAYAAYAAVTNSTSAPTALSFSGMGVANGKGGVLTGAQLVINNKNAVACEFHLWLFSNSNAAMTNDGSAFAPSTSDSNKVTATPLIFTPANMSDGTNSRVYSAVNLPLAFFCDPADTALYGELETRTAYTPTANETYKFVLGVIQST